MGYKTTADGTEITAGRELQLGQDKFHNIVNGNSKMNIDGRSLGTPEIIWDGSTDPGTDWAVDHGIGSEQASAAHSGNLGWDTGVAALNDDTRFNSGGNFDLVGQYAMVSFWMQPKAFPPGAKLRVQWQNAANNVVGNTLIVEDYVTDMDVDVWQQVSLPIGDFGITADVAKMRFQYRSAAGQQFWFDDIELAPVGSGPYAFRVEAPDASTRYHLSMMVIVIAAPATGWDASSFANISGGLDSGMLLRQKRKSTGDVLWSVNSKNNVDLFGRYHPQEDITFADGDLLMGFMIKPGKASIVITDDDVLDIVIRDDFSSLSEMRAYAHFGVEVVE